MREFKEILENIKNLYPFDTSVHNLCIELEEERSEQYCHWFQQDDEFSDVWLACGDKLFCINSETPRDNGMLFCPYCGKNIVEHLYNEHSEEQEIIEEGF